MKRLTNEVARCQPTSLRKKVSHIFLHVFCLHTLRTHYDYFFRKRLWNCASKIFFRKYKQNVVSHQTFVLMKTSSRRLDQGKYICPSHTSSEDVLKTFSRRLGQNQYIRLGYTSSRRFQGVFKTSSKRLQNVFKTSCKNVFKMFWRRLQDVIKDLLQRFLQDFFKTYHRFKLLLLISLREVLQKRLSTEGFA